MESLRNFLTGPRLILVVLVCALPFVFLGTSSLSTVFTGSFGSINGEDVSETDIQMAANSAVQRFNSIYGDSFDFNSLDEDLRSESIKQELIVQKVLQSGARELGFINKTSNREAQKGIIRTSQFQVDGVFSEDVYEAQVNSSGYTKEGYLNLMTDLYASELYRNSLLGINFITDREVYELTSLLEKTTDINFTKISFDDLKEQIVNTSDELLSFYEENPVLFYTEETRGFKYFLLNQSDYEDLVQVPDGYINSAYENYINNFENSAQVRFAHIMIDKNNYEDVNEALMVINEVQSQLKSGEDFSILASKFSEDLVTKDIGGDLEYFEKDVFPVEFDDAIAQMQLNETSDVIELDDTFHILKVTELIESNPLPESEIKDQLLKELIETESFALLNDDFSKLEDVLFSDASIEDVAESVLKELTDSSLFSETDYNFEIDNLLIRDYLFSVETEINKPTAIELGDQVIVMAVDRIIEPSLEPFEMVAGDVAELLAESKSIEKISLLNDEILSIQDSEEKNSFIGKYSYISEESFVDVKRYSSLLPGEVLSEIFNNSSDKTIYVDANNGDKYIINILSFNTPNDEDIKEIYTQYNDFGAEQLSSKMQQIVNEDVFQSAKVNLNSLIQF